MTTYVFLGPSLPVEQASRLLDATYLPPIQQGDLLRLLDRNPRHVGIIDGYFETVPAVWHKEILLAMSRGVHVFGAASMGAIRAAELHSFGMVGVGTVFAWYRDGRITADDEVAVRHGPAELGYLTLGNALVDIRDSCSAALQAGVVTAQLAERIVAVARELPYWERSYDAVATELGQGYEREAERWLAYAKAQPMGLKARDAAALLAEMKRHADAPWTPKQVDFTYERTVFIERLINDLALERAQDGGASPVEAALDGGEQSIERLRRETLLKVAAREAARTSGWEPSVDEMSEEAEALCAQIGLADPQSVQAWLDAHSIPERVFWAYVSDELLIKRLARKYQLEIDRELPEQLRLARARQRSPSSGTPDST